MRSIYISIIVSLFFSMLGQCYAQAVHSSKKDSLKTYHLGDVVVTATRNRTPEAEVASSISVIDSAEIAAKAAGTVFSLLKDQYGLSYSTQGAPGSLSYVYLRGADPGQTLILVDGVEMNLPNDPSNTFDFADLSSDQVKRIEILRGPQSTLYGSNALAGVINIITRSGSGKPAVSLSAEGGSYNTYKLNAGVNGGSSIIDYSVSAGKTISDGYSSAASYYNNTEKDGTSDFHALSKIGLNLSPVSRINLIARYTKAKTDFDQHGGPFGDDPTYIYNLAESALRAEGKFSLFDGLWETTAGISLMRNVRSYSFDSTLNDPATSSSIYDGRRFKIDWQNNLNLIEDNIITVGLERVEENAVSYYYYNSYGSPYSSYFPEKSSVTFGAYIQDQLNLGKSFFTTAGIRFDHHSKFGSVTTFRIAPAYIFWETGTKIKATYGTAFKAPSLFYLFDPAYGNQNLRPEKSEGWDAGIEQYLFNSDVTLGVTYFRNSYTDLFGFDKDFKTININKALTKGVELYATARIKNTLTAKVNYTYTDAKDVSGSDNGTELIRRPQNKAGLSILYYISGAATAGADFIYVGSRNDNDFSTYPVTTISLGGYLVINLSASYKISGPVSLYGRIDNLLNKRYEEIFGYATPGLSGYLGVKLNL